MGIKKQKPTSVAIKGSIRIAIAVCVPRNDRPELSDIIEVDPIIVNIEEVDQVGDVALKRLPPGLLAEVRGLLEEMAKLARTHVHGPLKLKEPEQKIVMANEADMKAATAGPTVEVFRPGQRGGPPILVGSSPLILDAQGLEMGDE